MTENYAITSLIEQREEISNEISDLNAQLREKRPQLKDLEAAIESLGGGELIEKSAPKRNYGGPTLKELIIDSLPESGAGTTAIEIANKLTENGRPTKNTAVSSTLSRLSREGEAVKKAGKWFKANYGHQTAQESSVDDKKGGAATPPSNFNQTPTEGYNQKGGVYGTFNPSD